MSLTPTPLKGKGWKCVEKCSHGEIKTEITDQLLPHAKQTNHKRNESNLLPIDDRLEQWELKITPSHPPTSISLPLRGIGELGMGVKVSSYSFIFSAPSFSLFYYTLAWVLHSLRDPQSLPGFNCSHACFTNKVTPITSYIWGGGSGRIGKAD